MARASRWEAGVPSGHRAESSGVKATVFGAKETNHRKLNDNLGTTDDPATKILQEFVDACLAK
jgi:hypothetical protein